jgi:Zn-dependent protease with chaperone function
MFNQLIYFLIALLLFSIQQPGAEAIGSPFRTIFLAGWVFCLYVLICYLAFRSLKQHLHQHASLAILTLRYHRIQARLSVLALGFLAVDVFVFNIKSYLHSIPWFEQSLTVSGSVGLALYLLHLGVLRFWGYPIYRWIHQSSMKRSTFLKEHLTFDCALLVPWFIISFLIDLLEIARDSSFLTTEIGETTFLALALTIFILLGPWMVVRLWRCEPLPASTVREQLEQFCGEHRFKMGDFLLWPLFGGEMLTAAVMGILPRVRYILLTQGILKLLNIEELKAVVAHEMGHVRRYHLLFYLFLFISYSGLAYSVHGIILLLFLKQDTILQWALSSDSGHLTLFSVIYSIPILLLIVIYFRYIFGFFMRNSERQADLYAFQLVGHPFTLISSLQKIALYSGQIEDLPSWHHFSIRQRIDFLLNCHRDPSLIRRHHQKLYGSALLFLVAVVSLSWLGLHIQTTETVQNWQREVQLRILEHELGDEPRKAELYSAYGGILLEQKRYREAEAFLQKGFEMASDNPTTINNLAWLYATAPPPHFKPEKALKLALQAAELDPQPYVLDTLAESYYVNGYYEEALEAIEHAIAEKPENRDYYLQQRIKFQESLRKSGRRE